MVAYIHEVSNLRTHLVNNLLHEINRTFIELKYELLVLFIALNSPKVYMACGFGSEIHDMVLINPLLAELDNSKNSSTYAYALLCPNTSILTCKRCDPH